MTSRGFCSTSLACAIAWKKKKIARENVQGARLTNLIWSRETRLERSLRNLVWKFNNERRTFEERKLRTLRLSSTKGETKKVSFYVLLVASWNCCPSFPNKISNLLLCERSSRSNGKCLRGENLHGETVICGYIWWMIESMVSYFTRDCSRTFA